MARSKTRNRYKAWLHFATRFVAVVLLSTFLMLSEDQRAAIAQALADPMSVLADRSPGERQEAGLRPTKVRHHVPLPKGTKLLSAARTVDEEELSREPGFFAENERAPLVADAALPSAGKPGAGTPPVLAHGSGGGNGGSKFFGGVGGGSAGGGGGGGGGGGDDGEMLCPKGDRCREATTMPTGEVIVPTIGVPEPATWATLLIGFFALGGLMRARMARAARAGVASSPESHAD
ncbi:MAG: hypothetical protein J7494_03330 [Sphingobium sp.]|nr:hypothetical protein [Sphingobium sp.]